MPDVAGKGVSNFFGNLFEIRNIMNNGLQGPRGGSSPFMGMARRQAAADTAPIP